MYRMSMRTGILWALWFSLLVNYLDRVAISIAGPTIMKSLAISPAEFGIVLSSFSMGYFLAQIPGGYIADRWGARTVFVACPLVWALCMGITGLIATVAAFMVVRFFLGLAEGAVSASNYKVVAEHFEPRLRSRSLALVTTGATIGPAVAGVVVGKLVFSLGWQSAFMILAGPSLAIAALWYFMPLRRPERVVAEEPEIEGKRSFRHLMRQPTLWLLAVSQFGFNFVTWGFNGWMPSYLAMARGIDVESLGTLSSIPYAAGFVGLVGGGWLGSTVLLHRYRPQLIIAGYVMAGLFLLLAFQAPTVEMSLVGLSGASFSFQFAYGPKGGLMLDLAPVNARGSYVGIVSTAGQIAGVIAPATIGFLVHQTGSFASGFGFMIGALFVAAACMVALTRYLPSPRRRAPEQSYTAV